MNEFRQWMSLCEDQSLVDLHESAESPVDMAILRDMLSRAPRHKFEVWALENNADAACLADEDCLLSEFEYWLDQEHSISISDGNVSFWTLTPMVERLIGSNPVILYHYTASTRVRSIRKLGLISGKRSVNRTVAPGVYLTSETGGPAINGYIRNAVQGSRSPNAYGVRLTIKIDLRDLEADEDDADIASGNHQFRVDYIAPSQIIAIDRA